MMRCRVAVRAGTMNRWMPVLIVQGTDLLNAELLKSMGS
jgi:hypothetical protein